MGNHKKTDLDKARDELMSHVIRCEVLEASMDDRLEWLNDTMAFMSERYPQLGDLHLAQLEMMGRQFLRPAIPHGAGHTAQSRGRRTGPAETDVETPEAEVGEDTGEAQPTETAPVETEPAEAAPTAAARDAA